MKQFESSDTVDTTAFIVTGGSAGAQLALSTSIQLLDAGVPVHGVAVLAPLAIGPSAVPSHMKDRYKSMTDNADAPLVDSGLLKQFMGKQNSDAKECEAYSGQMPMAMTIMIHLSPSFSTSR